MANGVDRILMTTSNPSKNKIKRAMALRKAHPSFIQAVDEEQNARDLSEAAKAAGVVADVVIDVAVGTRSGIPPGEGAVVLAQLVDKLPNLKLRGILSYDGGVQHAKGFAARKERALRALEPNVATFEAMKKSGLNVEIFSLDFLEVLFCTLLIDLCRGRRRESRHHVQENCRTPRSCPHRLPAIEIRDSSADGQTTATREVGDWRATVT